MAKQLVVYVSSMGGNYEMAFVGQPEVLNACLSHRDVIGKATVDDGNGGETEITVIFPWESVLEFSWKYEESEEPAEPVVDAFCEVTA